MNLNNLPIAKKLWGAILILLAAMLAVSTLCARLASNAGAEATATLATVHELVERSAQWKGLTDTAVTRGMANAISSDPAVGELFKENLANDTKKIGALRAEIGKVADTEEDKAMMKEIGAKGAALIATSKKATELAQAGDRAAVSAWVKGEYAQAAATYLGAIDGFVELQRKKGEAAVAHAEATRQRIPLVGGVSTV